MALDNSNYIIYRTKYKDNYLTIFRFNTKYDGLTSFLKLLDFPIFLISVFIFLCQFRSISLLKKLLKGDFEVIKKNSFPEHELEVLKDFEEYPTRDILDYLYLNSRRVNNIIKTGNITYKRWWDKYSLHLFNTKFLEKFSEDSKYISFIGCIPFPCLLNFKQKSPSILSYISYFVSAFPVFFAELIRLILFALGTNDSIIFSDKGIRNLKIYKLSKTKKIKTRQQIIVSIYFFREIEHFFEIVKSLPEEYEFIIVSLNRVKGIETFFLNEGFNISSEYLRVKKIKYFDKYFKTLIKIISHPIYIFVHRKKLNGILFYALVYNFFSIRSTIRLLCLREIINKNFHNYKFLSFNTWELPFIFYYNDKFVETFGRYCLVPGVYTSQDFRPHDYILSTNKLQFSQFSYLHNKGVVLLGKNVKENVKVKDNLNKEFKLKSKKYLIWVGTAGCPGISNEMLFNNLKKTKILSDYLGLKFMIRAHPTMSRENILEIYGELLIEDFIFDNDSPLEQIAKMPAIFSLTTSTADATILKYQNPCVCIGLDKVVTCRIGVAYKTVLGSLCHQNENIVLDALKKLDNNQQRFDEYKSEISKYLDSLIYPNRNFEKQLLNIFQNYK